MWKWGRALEVYTISLIYFIIVRYLIFVYSAVIILVQYIYIHPSINPLIK